MGERKGVNKYYPPDFDYKKHGSLDRYHNSHPLRERARKLKSEGILIIRFEMPYNIWCNGCNSHIGMGVRYNAEKKMVGKYYTTIIYKFRMKCHLCEQHFEIQTDPANCDYAILSGARRKEERWNAKDNEQIEMTDHEVKKQLMSDPMFKLEHNVKDKRKLQDVVPTLGEIQGLQEDKKDDYLLNKALRKTFREEKKKIEVANKVDRELLLKSSLDIDLVKETEEDRKMAGLIKFNTVKSSNINQQEVRDKIIQESIFKSGDSKLSPRAKKLKSPTANKQQDSIESLMNAKNLGIKLKRKRTKSNTSLSSDEIPTKTLNLEENNNQGLKACLSKTPDTKELNNIVTVEKGKHSNTPSSSTTLQTKKLNNVVAIKEENNTTTNVSNNVIKNESDIKCSPIKPISLVMGYSSEDSDS